MTPADVYEKYKHLDRLLSDPEWLPKSFESYILRDLWCSIRDEQAAKVIERG